MALEIIKNIDVDFYNKEYILINAKQYDANSRVISITCYNQGELMKLSDGQHSVYVRYKKADGHPVLNSCRINNMGQVLVELTEQMLAATGVCCVDLIVVNKGDAIVNTDTGEILVIDNSPILSTMAFYVNAYEASVGNSEVESSHEYKGLNDLMQRVEADYREVMLTSKSWAIGNTGIRDGENTDNSKYYSERSSYSANASNASALSASNSEINAEEHMSNALEYMNTAKTHMDEAKASEDNARTSEINAFNSEVATKSYMEATDGYMNTTDGYMTTTKNYMDTTEGYMNTAESHMTDAATSETNASMSETNAFNSATLAQSYTVGGTGTRDGEDRDNAHYYYEVVKSVVSGLNSGFIPMGTISFDELATAEKATGFTYNISNDFVTDSTFAEGEGKLYTAGTNVYVRYDGLWDCFGGTASPIATVDEVIEYLDLLM